MKVGVRLPSMELLGNWQPSCLRDCDMKAKELLFMIRFSLEFYNLLFKHYTPLIFLHVIKHFVILRVFNGVNINSIEG